MTHTVMEPGRRDSGHGGSRRRKPQRRRRPWRWVLLALVLILLIGGGTAWWFYHKLNSNISDVDINKALGEDRPKKAGTSGQNLLILGSDSRSGDNANLDTGDVSGARSDTALMVHIPEGRSRATAVSIPRDTLVTRPGCTTSEGEELPSAKRVMFNSVYSLGGPACVVKTVETLSGIRMDHYMEIDFAGFQGLVDALGGVSITLDKPINDTKGGLHLDAGTHHLDGTQSLRLVRTRYGYGDGSDLGRIGLQQKFMLAVLAEIKKQGVLNSPAKLYKIASSATESLTTDSGLSSLTSLAKYGSSLKAIDPNTMETVMMPVQYDTQDRNRVVAAEPQVKQLWEALRTDQEIPESAKKSPATGGE
ncbi:LCP family protein [Streptomyces tsukubensis]|uniref:Transcriptional regulator n=1 Tax=Streptomyces tsukubensis TaxID=83656 RepID=A0A1V4A9S3_9ACTN|nr:LCP family protein [Streptomyces tsukubensis]OON80582.1 transcriptional regulator [Streptomyces tsukubensis]QFR96234.1 LytR family transcriptional regulator [Streptomyces tsukubensis]